MTVAEQLASLRKEKGWSQAKLAKQTGLSPSSIAMYETNRRSPDEETLRRLARALDVDAEVLAGSSTTQMSSSNPPHQEPNQELTLHVSLDEARILLAMRMSPATYNFLLSYVNATEEERERLDRTWHVIRSFQQ